MKKFNSEYNTMPHAYFPSHVSSTVDVEGTDDIEEHEGEEPRHKQRRTEGETDGRMDREGEEGDNEEEDEREEQQRQEK